MKKQGRDIKLLLRKASPNKCKRACVVNTMSGSRNSAQPNGTLIPWFLLLHKLCSIE